MEGVGFRSRGGEIDGQEGIVPARDSFSGRKMTPTCGPPLLVSGGEETV
jgi:hypothetical protein